MDGTVKVCDAYTGQEIGTLDGRAGPVYGVAFSPITNSVASAHHDGTVKTWDIERGRAGGVSLPLSRCLGSAVNPCYPWGSFPRKARVTHGRDFGALPSGGAGGGFGTGHVGAYLGGHSARRPVPSCSSDPIHARIDVQYAGEVDGQNHFWRPRK